MTAQRARKLLLDIANDSPDELIVWLMRPLAGAIDQLPYGANPTVAEARAALTSYAETAADKYALELLGMFMAEFKHMQKERVR